MSDWTAGYVAEIGYTYGYYNELSPHRATLPLLATGVLPPKWGTACELGFGQGVSINVHAAASTTQWWGTDFNPEQAGFAQEMERSCGSGAELVDQAFAEFCARVDLPDFDYIALHGIWSWISDENRHVIADFIRRKLKVGGVLFISYNTLPGWSTLMPMRHLISEHARMMGAPGQPLLSRIDAALDFSDKLLALNPAFARVNPQVAERFKKLREQDRSYLAHEYFNRDWLPMPYSQMQQWLAPAKLSYACSAAYLSNIDSINMTPESAAFLGQITDPNFRETVRDMIVNQQFRRDYWVRGARRGSPLEMMEAIRREQVMLLRSPQDVQMQLTPPGGTGKLPLQEAIYRPLLEALSDQKARSVEELEAALRPKGVNHAKLLQALLVLSSRADVALVQDDTTQQAVQQRTDRLNQWLMNRARSTADINHLASPVTGGGVGVSRMHQLCLAAYLKGDRTADALARSSWKTLSLQGQRILKDGKPLQTEEENVAHLTGEAQQFLQKQLPMLQTLRVIARA